MKDSHIFKVLLITRRNGNKTPYEAKYGVVPDVSRRKFLDVYADEFRPKSFVDKAYKAYFLGFSETCTGAIVYDRV